MLINLAPAKSDATLRNQRKAQIDILRHQLEQENVQAFVHLLPQNMVLTLPGDHPEVPFMGTYEGQAIEDVVDQVFSSLDVLELSYQYALADSTYVSAHWRLQAHINSTDKILDAEVVFLCEFEEGAIRPKSCRAYLDTDLLVKAFTPGGSMTLVDGRDVNDDYGVLPSVYDPGLLSMQLYDYFYAGDITNMLVMASSDLSVFYKGSSPWAGVFIGVQACLTGFAFPLAQTAVPVHITRFAVTEGDRTDLVLYEEWQVYATQKIYHVYTVNSWRVNTEGKLFRFTAYPDTYDIEWGLTPD